MTANGVLYVQEELAHKLEDEIKTALKENGLDESFRLSGEGRHEPENIGGSWGNIEKRWPGESYIPIVQYQEQVGTLHVELNSVVKTTGYDEYVGREMGKYEITIDR